MGTTENSGTETAGHATCPYCRFPIESSVVMTACPSCSSTHHQDCWAENGGCSITGCASAPSATLVQGGISPTLPADSTAAPAMLTKEELMQPAPAGPSSPPPAAGPNGQSGPWGATTGPVGFGDAMIDGFRRAFQFRGRSSRSAFWWFTLGYLVLHFAVASAEAPAQSGSTLLFYIFLIPQWTLAVRRLHDTGRSGWRLLWSITGIGWLFLLVWYCDDSGETNEYGLSPRAQQG